MDLRFEPIKPENFSLAYGFLRDSFAVSFGKEVDLWPDKLRQLTESQYFEILRQKLAKHPEAALHVLEGDRIVGQIEWHILTDDKTCGYVSLYYLIPNRRGMGLGKYLDEFVCQKLASLGRQRAQLTVEPANVQAVAFYKKSGWIEIGRHPQHSGRVMEKTI
jgi:GNAT superfamily N-acetyltransferase